MEKSEQQVGSMMHRYMLIAIWVGFMSSCTNEPAPMTLDAVEARDLSGTLWLAISIDEHGVVDGSASTLQFEADNRISGSTGCNRYFGHVFIGTEEFSVSGMGSTRMACVPALMEQESQFLDALQDARRYGISQTVLILFDESGKPRLTLTPAEPTAAARDEPSPQDRVDPQSAASQRYACNDEMTVETQFVGPDTLKATIQGSAYSLMLERAASGAKYSGDGITFWNKGLEAMLQIADVAYTCQLLGP
jgi:heat shock protein HslJ